MTWSAASSPMKASCWCSPSTTGSRPSTAFPPPSTTRSPRPNGPPTTRKQLGIDASRLMVGGDSAGGNMAAVVAIAARDGNGAETRRPSADLSLDRFLAQARLAQGSHHLDPADAFGDHLVHGELHGRCRHQRLALLARARQIAGRPAAGLCAHRRRRSAVRRRRRICRAAEAGRRARRLSPLPRPVPRLLHHGQAAQPGQCRRHRDRDMAEGAELPDF